MLFVEGGHDNEYTDLRGFQAVLDELGNRATLHVVEGAEHFYDLSAGMNHG